MNHPSVTTSILAELDASKAQERRARSLVTRTFRGWLSHEMQAKNVSAAMLSEQLNCSETNIYRILHAGNTTIATIASLAHALGYTAQLQFRPMEGASA